MRAVTAPIGTFVMSARVTNREIAAGLHQSATAINAATDHAPDDLRDVLASVESELYEAADEVWLATEALRPVARRLLSMIVQGCIDRVHICLFSDAVAHPDARRDLARATSELRKLRDRLRPPIGTAPDQRAA